MNAPATIVSVRAADLSDPAERSRIDAYVAEHPEAEFFHRPQWTLAVERGCRQRGHYLVAESGRRGLVGCLPLTDVRSFLFGRALVSTGFGTGGGALADDEATARRLIEAGWVLAENLGCGSMELRGGPIPDGWSVRDEAYVGFAKPLPEGEEAIMRSIKRRHRSVRRARELDLAIRCGRDSGARAEHFRIYAESMRNLGSPVYPPPLFEAMIDLFGEDADILTVLREGRPVASVLNFYFRGTVHPYWGGGTDEARDCFANELMYFELMCHASRRGCTRFDFGRSKVGSGSASFKENWGFDPVPLRYGVRTAAGVAPRDINPASPSNRLKVAVWRRLPLAVSSRLGPALARGLG